MFFQFNISPVHKPKKPVTKPIVNQEEVPVLSLAPFTPIPKICFDNVLIGTTVTKALIIKNPTPNDIMLYLTKAPPDERRVAVNWVKCLVRSHSDTIFELIWDAVVEGGWKDTVTFQDGRRLKMDVAVIFKAVKPKNTKAKPKKVIKCVSTKVKSPKQWFSPKHKSSKTLSNTRAVLPDITNIPEITIDSPKNVSYSRHVTEKQYNFVYKNKENFDLSGIETLSSITSVQGSASKDSRRNFSEYPRNTKGLKNENFDDSLEINKSFDCTPNFKSNTCDLFNDSNQQKSYSIEDKLKEMAFTPTTFQPSICSTEEKSYNDENISTKRLKNVLNLCNISSSTFSIDNKSPPLNIEEKLANISSDTYIKGNISSETYTKGNTSSDTYIKGNISSSTYIKDGVSPETSFRGCCPSPINFEINRMDEVVTQPEFHRKPKQFLEQINEESHISFNNSQVNSTIETRKRRSQEFFKTVSPKRKTLEFNTSNNSRSLRRTNPIQFKSVNIREIAKQYNESLIIEEKTIIKSKQFEIETFPTQNPFILTATNSIDPFMSSTMYYDPRWVDEQTESFKKWLNALLTPPDELDSNAEGNPMDVAKLWQDCKKREVLKAPTKEVVSNKYHTKGRLQTLRRNAENYFRSPEISSVLSKVCMMIENNKLIIRDDKDIHLDLGLQAEITVLFLSYNPLWLRIGLETVYNVTIPLNSNSDVVGLVMFLSENFFKDPYLLKKYKSVHAKKYSYDIKKMILKKFFMFIFFLDKSKENKLIPHDPCLFCKNAPFKDSRSVILKFARELLSAIGDVTRIIKCTGYILSHKQIYIHEFDYAVTNLGADLRDGVRLTKVMEIILLVDGLINGLRVPAISRLQKIHNVKIAFDALKKAGFEILYEIEPKDIVDGHREKTLSFLWQIIYKFQAPRITKAVCTIQQFWRSLRVTITRRILQRERLSREKATITIQHWYRRLLLVRKLNKIIPTIQEVLTGIRRERAAKIIQSNFRMATNRKRYLNLRKLIIGLQSYSRRYLALENINFKATAVIQIQAFFRMCIARKYFIKIKAAAMYTEELYLAKRKMKIELNNYQKLKNATLYIQSKYRAKLAMKRDMQQYAQMKCFIISIQRHFRATKLMHSQRNYYSSLKISSIFVQQKYRANKAMVIQRKQYLLLRSSVMAVQQRYRAKQQMLVERSKYQTLRRAVIVIQTRFKANLLMKKYRTDYLKLQNTTKYIQSRYRAKIAMRNQKMYYDRLRQVSVVVQTRFRAIKKMRIGKKYYESLKFAAVVIQRKYRAKKLGEIDRRKYFSLKTAVKTIEERYIANKMMKTERSNFLNTKMAVLFVENKYLAKKLGREQFVSYHRVKKAVRVIQDKFRANKEMRMAKSRYANLKNATMKVQERFRANKLARIQRRTYLLISTSVVTIQQWYKATKMARGERAKYLELKNATRIIESRFIAKKLMKHHRQTFLNIKKAVRSIEEKFVAKKLTKLQLKEYHAIKLATTVIQHRFRANKQMKETRKNYLELKKTTIIVQRRFRANKLTKIEQNNYLQLKKTVKIVQTRFRSNILMRENRVKYLELKKSAIIVQQRYRANKLRDIVRENYLDLKNAVRIIENRIEANKLGTAERQTFLAMKKAVRVVEERFTAKKLSEIEYKRYLDLRKATIIIQNRFRANMQMKSIRQDYLKLTQTVINVQNRYRANTLSKTERCKYLQYKNSVNIIKNRYRANKLMELDRQKYLEYRRAVVMVQRRFRSNKLAQTVRNEYVKLKKSVHLIENKYISTKIAQKQFERYKVQKKSAIIIQRSFRAYILAKKQRLEYLRYKKAVNCIQERFRANKLAKIKKMEYVKLRKACQLVQRRFKANCQMKLERNRFLELKKATVTIQQRFRAMKIMKVRVKEYSLLRNNTILIQRRYRANYLMKIDHERFRAIRKSVIIIQRRFRAKQIMEIYRNRYQKLRNAALIIQRRYRAMALMKFEKKRYGTLKIAVRKIEKHYIANKLIKEQIWKEKLLSSTIYIQQHYRRLRLTKEIRQDYLALRSCVIAMQRRFRSNKEAKYQRDRYVTLRESVILIQGIWRERGLSRKRRLNIIIVQAFIRGFIARRRFRKSLPTLRENKRIAEIERKAATKIQTCWRGYKTRSVESPELTKIRMKAKVANTKVQPEKTLAYKKEKALNALISENTSLEQIIAALRDLDYITRRCKDTCVNMSQLLPEDLYRIITSSSRSLPEMQSCTAATGILINFCKYPQTTATSWCPDYLDSIVTVMIHWCDKEYPLFLYLATLIWLLAHNPQQKRVIKRIPNISQKLLKMKQLCERKRKMALRIPSKGNEIFASYKNVPLPLFAPDWGLEYAHKPRTFQNSVHAMESVLNILDMNL